MRRLAPMAMLALALAGCRHSDHGSGWHRHAIPECGFSLELPGRVRRSERVLPDGARVILYSTGAEPDMYIVGCTLLPETLATATPAQALEGQLANHVSKTELGGIGVAITDSGSEESLDGGRYWILFANGMRIEGRVRLSGRQVEDLSGSLLPNSKTSRAALERMMRSTRRP